MHQRLKPGQVDANSKLTDAVQETICKYLSEGMSLTDSVGMAGINRKTAWTWKCRGEQFWDDPITNRDDWRFGEYEKAVTEAELSFKRQMTQKVCQDADWRGSLAYLKSRYKIEWSELHRNEISGIDGRPIETHESNPFQVQVILEGSEIPADAWRVVDHQEGTPMLPMKEYPLPGGNSAHSETQATVAGAREPAPGAPGVDLSMSQRNQANGRQRWTGGHPYERTGRCG